MANKNTDFLDVLSRGLYIGDPSNTAEFNKDRDAALNELLRADPGNPKSFREAIIGNLRFWDYPALRLQADQPLTPESVASPVFFQTDGLAPGEPTLALIHQKVAEQRVRVGLETAPEDVLVGILTNNPDECRAYLATKRALMGNLAQAPGWVPSGPATPPTVPGRNVLSEAAITRTKEIAAIKLVYKLVENSKDLATLEKLRQATPLDAPPDDISTHLVTLGFPNKPHALKTVNDLVDVISDDRELTRLMDYRIQLLKQSSALKNFEQYVDSLSSEELVQFKKTLEKDQDGFRDALISPFKENLANKDIGLAKNRLGLRFLQEYLPQKHSIKDLVTLINTDTQATEAAIKKLLPAPNQEYIKLDPQNLTQLNSLKTSLMTGVMKKTQEIRALNSIIAAQDLNQLKEFFKNTGITNTDWLTDPTQMVQIQQAARSRSFELLVAKTSKLGAGPHPRLRQAFESLSPQEQQKILKNEDNQLRHLLKAKDATAVRYYLGNRVADKLLKEVVNENINNQLFNNIHNSKVARILANNPDVTLNKAQVTGINQAFNSSVMVTPFLDVLHYKAFVDAIKSNCGRVNVQEFYQDFGLKADGSGFADPIPNPIVADIKTQYDNNAYLLSEYYSAKNSLELKHFLAIFLPLEKGAVDKNKLQALVNAFDQAETLKDFLDSAAQIQPQDPVLASALTHELTHITFQKIKTELAKDDFAPASPPNIAQQSMDKMADRVKTVHNNQKSLKAKMDGIKPLVGIEPVHLFNPSFEGKAKAKAAAMKEEYLKRSEECALAIDHLKRDRNTLTNFLESLPKAGDPPHPDADIQKKLIALRKKVQSELDDVKENLSFYQKFQEKLSGKNGILDAIDAAVEGRKTYVYHATGFKPHRYNLKDGRPLPNNLAITPKGTVVHVNDPGSTTAFLLDEKLKETEAIDYDVTFTTQITNQGVVSNIVTYGCFTETHPRSGSTSMDENGVISRVPSARFEVKKAPQAAPGQKPEDVEEAKVNMYMGMAIEALAKYDSPPTKNNPIKLIEGSDPEEIRYLYTAFAILADKDPNMKFGLDAIKVQSIKFKPESERTSRFGGLYNTFSDTSLYNTVFKKYLDTQASPKIEQVKELNTIKFGKDKDMNAAVKSTSAFKEAVKEIKEPARKNIAAEGIAPENPDDPSHSI